MALLIRPLRQWSPKLRHFGARSFSPLPRIQLLFSSSPAVPETASNRRHLTTTVPSALRRARGLKQQNIPGPYEFRESDSGSDSDNDPSKKSRNQMKREARRAVQWAIDLASFSTPQIKRILRATSMEPEVLEALVLVKRMGRDIREGKRRQFNYIGKLLRDADSELMDGLIQATKDGDESRLQALVVPEAEPDDDDIAEDLYEEDYEEEEEELPEYINIASRWFEGLVCKDKHITNEVYSIRAIDFDRQELRKLVRNVHFHEQESLGGEENEIPELAGAEKSLNRFLTTLAKQMHAAEI